MKWQVLCLRCWRAHVKLSCMHVCLSGFVVQLTVVQVRASWEHWEQHVCMKLIHCEEQKKQTKKKEPLSEHFGKQLARMASGDSCKAEKWGCWNFLVTRAHRKKHTPFQVRAVNIAARDVPQNGGMTPLRTWECGKGGGIYTKPATALKWCSHVATSLA